MKQITNKQISDYRSRKEGEIICYVIISPSSLFVADYLTMD